MSGLTFRGGSSIVNDVASPVVTHLGREFEEERCEAAHWIGFAVSGADSDAADFVVATAVWIQFDLDAGPVNRGCGIILDWDATARVALRPTIEGSAKEVVRVRPSAIRTAQFQRRPAGPVGGSLHGCKSTEARGQARDA